MRVVRMRERARSTASLTISRDTGPGLGTHFVKNRAAVNSR